MVTTTSSGETVNFSYEIVHESSECIRAFVVFLDVSVGRDY